MSGALDTSVNESLGPGWKEGLARGCRGALSFGARYAVPPRLQRRRFRTWIAVLTRAFATVGLLLAALAAATSQRGLMSLAFLTAAALLSIAVMRAYRAARATTAALRVHRTVRGALNGLAPRGWQLRHNIRWPGGAGDGHLAITPTGGLGFAIKDCSAPIDDFDLAQTQELATALSQSGRPYVPICVALAGDRHSFSDRGVLCTTPGLLAAELLDAEGAFLASIVDESAHSQLLYNEAD
jgi:hypothetical protein